MFPEYIRFIKKEKKRKQASLQFSQWQGQAILKVLRVCSRAEQVSSCVVDSGTLALTSEGLLPTQQGERQESTLGPPVHSKDPSLLVAPGKH